MNLKDQFTRNENSIQKSLLTPLLMESKVMAPCPENISEASQQNIITAFS